jgi:hypothetical protein
VWYFFSYNRVALLSHWGKILPYITLIYNNVLAINTLFKQAVRGVGASSLAEQVKNAIMQE